MMSRYLTDIKKGAVAKHPHKKTANFKKVRRFFDTINV